MHAIYLDALKEDPHGLARTARASVRDACFVSSSNYLLGRLPASHESPASPGSLDAREYSTQATPEIHPPFRVYQDLLPINPPK
jgi:hypothetical protein